VKGLLCGAVLLLASGVAMAEPGGHAAGKPTVVTIKDAQGKNVGTATLTSDPKGVKIAFDIKGMAPGQHSVHIHQNAKCDAPDFKSAGPHFEPAAAGGDEAMHNHTGMAAGDIPDFSLYVGADGTAHVSAVAPNVTLGMDDHSVFSNGGTAIVIHAVSSGGDGSAAPARIACGVITK
jgi:Cu-Zn family superoxide dismutase